MSRGRRSVSRRSWSRSEEKPVRRKEGRKDEDRLALRAEEERDKSGDGSERGRDSCVGDVVEPGAGDGAAAGAAGWPQPGTSGGALGWPDEYQNLVGVRGSLWMGAEPNSPYVSRPGARSVM